jgi:hypothetical protein
MSAPTLSEFSANLLKKNIARQNLFYVTITVPSLLSGVDNELASMWCHAAQTPHMFLSTNDNFVENGVRRKYAYDIDYQNLVLNFYIDQDFEVKKFFDKWKQLIIPYGKNFNYYNDYTAETLTISLLNQADDVTYKYEFKKVYPKTINNLELSFAGAASILDLSVELVFEDVYFTSVKNGSKEDTSVPETLEKTGTTVPANIEIKQNEYDNGESPLTDLGLKLYS